MSHRRGKHRIAAESKKLQRQTQSERVQFSTEGKASPGEIPVSFVLKFICFKKSQFIYSINLLKD